MGKVELDVKTYVDSVVVVGHTIKAKEVKQLKRLLLEAIEASKPAIVDTNMYVSRTSYDDLRSKHGLLKAKYEVLANQTFTQKLKNLFK